MSSKDLSKLLEKLTVDSGKDEFVKIEVQCRDYLNQNLNGNLSDSWLDTVKVYFYTLLGQDKYHILLEFFNSNIELLERSSSKEVIYIYVLYSLYKLDKASEFLGYWEKVGSMQWIYNSSPVSVEQRHLLHIFAQFCLRQGQYRNAFEIYSYLTENNSGHDNSTELTCNQMAQLIHTQDIETEFSLETDSYDLLFNQSMVLVSRRQYSEAAKFLEKALTLANSDLFDEDIRTIKLQLAYVQQMLGNGDESKKLLKSLLTGEKSDVISLLARNNLKSFEDISKYRSNLPLILREINQKRLLATSGQSLSKEQLSTISANILFLKLFGNQKIRKSSSSLSSVLHFYSSSVDDVVFDPYKTQAKLLKNKFDEQLSEVNAESLLSESILCIKLQIHEKNLERAISIAEKYWNILHESELSKAKMAMSYILIQLYERVNRTSSLSKLLNKLFSLLSEDLVKQHGSFWKFLAFKFLSQGQSGPAIAILERYGKFNPSDKSLPYVFGNTDIDMGSVAELVEGVDAQELISNGVAVFESGKKAALTGASTTKKKRRIHKNKKNSNQYDSSTIPDPERWLPMKDRSYYKVSKKQISRDTQGGKISRTAEAKLDITKKTAKKSNSKNRKKK